MIMIESNNEKISIETIKQFENENEVKLTEKYKKFLLQWNGGYPSASTFKISDEKGHSVLNVFNGIGDMYDNLEKVIDIYEYRLPNGFIPIADDSAGNVICLGTNESYYENIYFWDHEQESENPNDMSNMYFLANDINKFLSMLHETHDE
ncbi:SMI1/KNR4 family protein [Fictibacillus phosphorivorans]|uniref:SMI1/KNR4 family protein n=1 Tax=Fictibacillus phosphorivorans TaxID=1221500 RepID=UPI003CEF6A8D